jgi:pimeloyl-ACP methyl ester carboxylesterase
MSRVDVDGVGIEYQVTGEGRPVVLLHGFPDSGRLWRHQVPALAAAGFQVVVPDLRGYGRSGKPEAVDAYSPGMSWRSSPTWRSPGPMWWATTGARP